MIPVSERQWTRRGRSRIPTFKTVLGCEGEDETYVRLKQKERKKRLLRKEKKIPPPPTGRPPQTSLQAPGGNLADHDHTFGIFHNDR